MSGFGICYSSSRPPSEGAGAIVQVPVKFFRQYEPLHHLDADCVHERDQHEQAGDAHFFGEAEFVCLLDAGHQAGAEIGKTDHFSPTRLCPLDIGGEIGSFRECIVHAAQHAPRPPAG
jgi:hypothetical protein